MFTSKIRARRGAPMPGTRRRATIVAVLLGLVASGQAGMPAAAAEAKPKPKVSAPALISERGPQTRAETPAGDFANPPDPSAPPPSAPARSAFDPARSVPVDAETTPTAKVYRNDDGTHTAELTTTPTRFRGGDGVWRDIDLSVVAASDGTLGPRAAPAGTRLGASAADEVVSIDTPGGRVGLRHPGAAPVAGQIEANKVTYPKALAGGRHLSLQFSVDGVEEAVVLPDATSGPTYRNQLALPPGLGARQGANQVELTDAAGVVVATYGGGTAHDARFPAAGPSVTTAVSVRLVETKASTAEVEVSIDAGWLAEPSRAFPVTIDPTLATVTAGGTNGYDTFILNGASANTSFGTSPYLYAGTPDAGTSIYRSLLWFNLASLPAPSSQITVVDSHLEIWEWYAAQCAARPLTVSGLVSGTSTTWTANMPATTWNSRPTVDATGVVSTTQLGCPATWKNLDTTSLAQRWLHDGAENKGLTLRAASETDSSALKGFYSSRYVAPPGGGGPHNPKLYVTYNRLPSAALPAAPADRSVLVDETPTLSVNAATDADGDAVQYWFRAGTGVDVEGGHGIDSGWFTPGAPGAPACPPGTPTGRVCWTVPAGALIDGVYFWHVFTTDGVTNGAFTAPPNTAPPIIPAGKWSFRATLRLGADASAPTDTAGPIQANLASGNAMVGHASPRFPTQGGDVGVNFAYNSAARTNGLVGEYYPGSDFPSSMSTAPAITRTDPSVAFTWGTATPPGPGLGTDNYVVRWTGNVTVTNAGAYVFYASTTDGVKVWLNNSPTPTINSWDDPGGSANREVMGAPLTLTAGATIPIRVEYRDQTGPANVALGVVVPPAIVGGPTKNIVVPPSWLTAPAAGPMAAGWTLGAGTALGYTSARIFEHGVTLTDATGGLHTYAWTGSGYTPPSDEDGVLARDADGLLSLAATDGMTYVFDAGGGLTSATTATDDTNQASAKYLWRSFPRDYDPAKPSISRLEAISDPVAGRQMTLRYAGFNPDPNLGCPAPPSGQNLAAAPSGKLCQVDNWDGTFTRLWYNAAEQLVRVVEDPVAPLNNPPAAVSDFAYDPASAKLSKVRDPLANDAVAASNIGTPPTLGAPFVADNDTSRTLVAYDVDNRVTHVTLPVPYDGTNGVQPDRPGRGYEYRSATETWVHVDGLAGSVDEPHGYNRKLTYDLAGRVEADFNATADVAFKATTFTWDEGDRLTARTVPAVATNGSLVDRRSTTVYDGDVTRAQRTGRVTDTYGPAPSGCFAIATGRPNGTCAVPPAHTATEFDRPAGVAATGLAVSAWANDKYQGPPKSRAQAAPDINGVLVGAGLGADTSSVRYSGEINLATTGNYVFSVSATGSARLLVDDAVVVDASGGGTATGTMVNGVAGWHRVRIDFAATTGTPRLELAWTPPAASARALVAADLAPRFANPTKTTVDDDSAVPAKVTDTSYPSLAEGLVTDSIVDPGTTPKLNLVTTTGYEAPGDASTGRFRRPTSRTLPAGNAAHPTAPNPNTSTLYAYYGAFLPPPTPGAPSTPAETSPAVCGRPAGVNQAGRPKTTQGPSPDASGNGRRVTEVVYDAAGRVVASRVGAEAWSCTGFDARGRISSQSFPAFGTQPPGVEPARAFAYDYAVGGNPFQATITEGTDDIVTKIDLLGRVISYSDIWNKVTTSTYDRAGRRTHTNGPTGALETKYDPAGRTKTQRLDNADVAQASYDDAGELSGVSYPNDLFTAAGNGTALTTIERHPSGATTRLRWTDVNDATMADDVVNRSQSTKVVNETIDGIDADPADRNFRYDAAGRLTRAVVVTGQTLDYAFEPTGGCGPQTSAGRNTNRTKLTNSSLGSPTTYCYDSADRLTSSSDAAVGTPVYDAHGNTTTLGTQSLIYDGADRHMATKVAGVEVVRYQRDPTGRITSRTEGTSPAAHYGFAGPGDSASFTMDANNTVTERTIGLVGGALLTKRGTVLAPADVWSYPNVHGDVMAVANSGGVKQGDTLSYDPFGTALGGLPDNSAGAFDYGWLGQHQRPIEHTGSLATIEMGARQYVPSLGRFLEVDPVEGGSCNDYDYVCGDSVNRFDAQGDVCWSCHVRRAGNLVRNPGKTAAAYAAARASGADCSDRQGMWVCQGVGGRLGKAMRSFGLDESRAITIGGVVLTTGRPFDVDSAEARRFLAHEASHGSQWAAGGNAFLAPYIAGAIYEEITGNCNPLERYAKHGAEFGCGG